MNDDWPPSAPPLRRQFANPRAAAPEAAPKEDEPGMVSRQQIEELEKQKKQPTPHLILTPAGSKPDPRIEAQRLEGIARMKEKMEQRLRERQARNRDDFEKARER